jgi:hypothetical protein
MTNTVICSILWVISMHEFIFSTKSWNNKESSSLEQIERQEAIGFQKILKSTKKAAHGLVLTFYAAALSLMWLHVPTPQSLTYGILSVAVPIIGVLTMKYAR